MARSGFYSIQSGMKGLSYSGTESVSGFLLDAFEIYGIKKYTRIPNITKAIAKMTEFIVFPPV